MENITDLLTVGNKTNLRLTGTKKRQRMLEKLFNHKEELYLISVMDVSFDRKTMKVVTYHDVLVGYLDSESAEKIYGKVVRDVITTDNYVVYGGKDDKLFGIAIMYDIGDVSKSVDYKEIASKFSMKFCKYKNEFISHVINIDPDYCCHLCSFEDFATKNKFLYNIFEAHNLTLS